MQSNFILEDKFISLKEFYSILESNEKIIFSKNVEFNIKKSNQFLNSLLDKKVLLYGINTGYGPLATTHLPLKMANELQKNLIYHLSAGVGEPLSQIHVRATMLARLVCFSKGYSGVSVEAANTLKNFFNESIIPVIPKLGTVGASGDLTPLAHMTLSLMGESKVFYKNKIQEVKGILKKLKWKPLKLGPKDGLAFVNGTSVMTGISAANGILSERAIHYSIFLSFLYAEILNAKEEAFHPSVGVLKPHSGIQKFLEKWNQYAKTSKRFKKRQNLNQANSISYQNELLQDAYTIRTSPQVLGAVLDIIKSHNETIEIEINSVSDNPIFLSDKGVVIHAGNFQGQSVAFVADNLYNALTTIGIHTERKIARITDSKLNGGLPNFLQEKQNGLHSGFMGAQVTATSLVAWMRSHATPASIQSIPTNANNQDIVSMGTIASLKTSECIDRVFEILSIESLILAQAFDLKKGNKKENGFSEVSIQFVKQIRKISPFLKKDRPLSTEIQKIASFLKQGLIDV